MDLAAIWDWVLQHDWQMVLFTSYVLMNVGPRPHPENMTGYKRVFWTLVDRLAWLSAEKVPGNWKFIFAPSEPLEQPSAAASAAAKLVEDAAAPPVVATLPVKPSPAEADPPPEPPKGAA